jgi:hypothetical protein
MGRSGVLVVAALAACLAVGCGSKVSVEEGRAKIEELASKGVPEREMSDIKMYLFQMETAKKTGNSSLFKTYQDSLTRALGEFEGKMTAILEQTGPFMDSLRRACDDKIALLNGLHLEAAGKGKGLVDSLMQIESQKMYARNRLETWSFELDTLVTLQKLADSLRKEFVGKWIMEKASSDPKHKMVERTEIVMRPNGTLSILEGRKGQLNDYESEDWMFESSGTWDVMGDVAYHYITKEKRVRQIFEGIDPQTGKRRKEAQLPYDSTITKGTKDNAMSWNDFEKAGFHRFPIGK